MRDPIAIVGMACRYPDARSPGELWENVLHERRAFRRLPPERLGEEGTIHSDRSLPDRTYVTTAALIEGYSFDRSAFRVAGDTYRQTDLAHWLALDIASAAFYDAGFPDGRGLPRDGVGVLVGNTLTGEFSRAGVMRLRWPYVFRVVDAALAEQGWSPEERERFLSGLESSYKAPFPPVGEETLAGGLSNTIAGRICNHFDLRGGGYTVDAACASSLLAVANACSALAAGDLDVALAGGVDLSLDPFELVGFAKIGVLATDDMRVYDARPTGFWPGEGCGMVVLMRLEDALAEGRPVYATIRGWGVSSDGQGGLTRPESAGQLLAIRRAYRRAGFEVDSVQYFEGHGTGTEVGDATELEALSRALRECRPEGRDERPRAALPAIGTVKANLGHTKAAAGLAGLLKAVQTVHERLLPPTTGCRTPHALLEGDAADLRVLGEPEPLRERAPLRAGINSMGFGGINVHVVLEGPAARQAASVSVPPLRPSAVQDAELFLFAGSSVKDLLGQVRKVSSLAGRLSRAELTDLAVELEETLPRTGTRRAAVVASTPEELESRLEELSSRLESGGESRLDPSSGVFAGRVLEKPRIGLLFPGQASPVYLTGGALERRFEDIREIYRSAALPAKADTAATEVAQPAIAAASAAAVSALARLGLSASVAIGHSIGELAALHWAGSLTVESLLRLVKARGRHMAALGRPGGAMAGIGADGKRTAEVIGGEPVVVAACNSPRQTVIAGPRDAVERVSRRAGSRGIRATLLPVSHAFHSELMDAVQPALAEALAAEALEKPHRSIVSTITGGHLGPRSWPGEEGLRELLVRQLTTPVLFADALRAADPDVDLWLETGPGHVLTTLTREQVETPVVALDAGGPSLRGLLEAVAAAFVLGAGLRHRELFRDRFHRLFDLDWKPQFFSNPCERGTGSAAPPSSGPPVPAEEAAPLESQVDSGAGEEALPRLASPVDTVRSVVARKLDLPAATIPDDARLLGDLHLNSISVAEVLTEAARELGLPAPRAPTEHAHATVGELAHVVEELKENGSLPPRREEELAPPGVEDWVRPFVVEWTATPRVEHSEQAPAAIPRGRWEVMAPVDHALAAPLRRALADPGISEPPRADEPAPGGVIVCLPAEPAREDIDRLLEAGRKVLRDRSQPTFVLVHEGVGASFSKTLFLEQPGGATCAIQVPPEHPEAVKWVLSEIGSVAGHVDVRYDPSGRRFEPVLRALPTSPVDASLPLGSDDVLLVTGGGKGIAAECALALARRTGARLALLGRSSPAEDTELEGNLRRMSDAGVRVEYFAADVTDGKRVAAAVKQAEASLGPVTALLHGAGTNVPCLIEKLTPEAFSGTLSPKVQGLENVLAALDRDRLRLLVTFSSIIARIGLPGEADYGVANEWLSRRTERFGEEHPQCRCLALEWSIWSGVGMGERMGRVETLLSRGITPITPERGIATLESLLGNPGLPGRVVVAGRLGEPPTIRLDRMELPLLRFLERPRCHLPRVELVTDVHLSTETDPYLRDHAFDGRMVLPAVMTLEAMAQVAGALCGWKARPRFEKVKFRRAVVVPADGSLTVRFVALAHSDTTVEVVLRSEETDFQVDHAGALCHFATDDPSRLEDAPDEAVTEDAPAAGEDSLLPLDPLRDLYGSLLFHGGRFRRLRAYRRLRATECLAEIAPSSEVGWFGWHVPGQLLLGDPAARDAAIHAVQACIPHARLLPVGVRRITTACLDSTGSWVAQARERRRQGDLFLYDVVLRDSEGVVRERWDGLELRKVEPIEPDPKWSGTLLVPYLEWRLRELIPGSRLDLALSSRQAGSRRDRTTAAIRRAAGGRAEVHHRPDGKPDILTGHSVSVAHADGLTLAVAGRGTLGCDMELIAKRPSATWRDLLGSERFRLAERIGAESGESLDAASTRVWAALESLKKAGAAADAPIVLEASPDGRWILLRSGHLSIGTCVLRARETEQPFCVALLVDSPHRDRVG